MFRTTESFEVNIPDGWIEAQGGGRYVCHGPYAEELIISATAIKDVQLESERTGICNQLWANAIQAAKAAASHPDLVVMSEESSLNDSSVPYWVLFSGTRDGTSVFLQAVFRSDAAVMLATLEGRNTVSSLTMFDHFCRNVRVNSDAEVSR